SNTGVGGQPKTVLAGEPWFRPFSHTPPRNVAVFFLILALQNPLYGFLDTVFTHAVVLDELVRCPRLAEVIIHADEFNRYGKILRETFSNSATHTSVYLMLFDGHDSPRFFRESDNRFL